MGCPGKYLLICGLIRDKNTLNRYSILNGIKILGPKYCRLLLLQIKSDNMNIKLKSVEILRRWGIRKCIENIDTQEKEGIKLIIQSILSDKTTDIRTEVFLINFLNNI